MGNAFPFAFNAHLLQQALIFRQLKFFLCPVNPYATKAKGMSGQHHVPHDKAAIVDAG